MKAWFKAKQMPLSQAALRLGGLLAFHVAWHAIMEIDSAWADSLNRWHCAGQGFKPNMLILEILVPSMLLGVLVVGRNSAVHCPVLRPWTVFLWPVFVLCLDAVHLVWDHQGRLFWWPETGADTVEYFLWGYFVSGVFVFGGTLLVLETQKCRREAKLRQLRHGRGKNDHESG